MWDIWFAKALSNWNLLQINDGNIYLFTNIYYTVLKSEIIKTTYIRESMTFSANVVNDQKHTIHKTL